MRWIAGGLCLAFLFGAAGCAKSITWVNDVAAAPDGKTVYAVGAQYTKQMFGDIVADKPMMWECKRGGDESLSCELSNADLPNIMMPGSTPVR